MNFIMLTHEYPYPANYGGHVYTSKLIENIIDAGHNLSIISAHPETTEHASASYHDSFRFFAKKTRQTMAISIQERTLYGAALCQ